MSENQTPSTVIETEGFVKTNVLGEEDKDTLMMYKCQGCDHVHFRHAGYVEIMIPWAKPTSSGNMERKADKATRQVMICVKCKKAYVWFEGEMYDITRMVDLEAWAKTESESFKATGPGGEC